MGYKLYKIIKLQEYVKSVQGDKHPIKRLDVPEIETAQELIETIINLCLTTDLKLDDIRVMEENIKLEGETWEDMKKSYLR